MPLTSSHDRIKKARELLEQAVHDVERVVDQRAVLDIVAYSPRLARRTRDARTYGLRLLQEELLAMHVVRLCALWGPADDNSFTLPRIVSCLRYEGVGEAVTDEAIDRVMTRSQRSMANTRSLGGTVGIGHYEIEDRTDAMRAGQSAREALRECVLVEDETTASPLFKRVNTFRSRELAHAVFETWQERKNGGCGAFGDPIHDDVKWLYKQTMHLTSRLSCAINGSEGVLRQLKAAACRQAEAFWGPLTRKSIAHPGGNVLRSVTLVK